MLREAYQLGVLVVVFHVGSGCVWCVRTGEGREEVQDPLFQGVLGAVSAEAGAPSLKR